MKTTYKYIKFSVEGSEFWFCRNKSKDTIIGWIEFYTPWKQFCFSPASGNFVFNKTCLLDIVDFLDQLKED